MSCFWKGILQSLSSQFKSTHSISHPQSLLSFFKSINSIEVFYRLVNHNLHPVVHHQGVPLSQKQLFENLKWVAEYDKNNLLQGHYTSTCDPFLLLLACFCDCSVEHVYNRKHTVQYVNLFNHSKTWLVFESNPGHFWFKGRETRS